MGRLPMWFLAAGLAAVLISCSGSRLAPDLPPGIKELEQELAADPDNGAILYVLARSYYRSGLPEIALDRLEQLGSTDWDYALDHGDFGDLVESPRYKTVAERIASREPRVARSKTAFELSIPNVYSEGMEWDGDRKVFYLGSAGHRRVLVLDSSGRVTGELPGGSRRLLAPLGMEIDPKHNVLWVASAAAPFMEGYDDSMRGQSLLTGIDLESGEVVTELPVGSTDEPTLLNDVTIYSGSRVAVTDSSRNVVWTYTPGDDELQVLTDPSGLWGPNGIASSPNGDDLLVATFRGIFHVRPDTGTVTPVDTPTGVYVGGIDGLYETAGSLIGIQNLVGRVRIWKLRLSPDLSRIEEATIIESGDDSLENPTTGAVVGDDFFYMANPGTAEGAIRMLRLRLGD